MRRFVRWSGWIRVVLLFLLPAVLAGAGGLRGATAQVAVLDATQMGAPVDLNPGPWRYSDRDEPRFAEPDFDDSGWRPFVFGRSLKSQGLKTPSGSVWFRLHVKVAPGAKDLAVSLDTFAFQLYANGRLLAQAGGYPDKPAVYNDVTRVVALPPEVVASGMVVLAVRAWFPPIRGFSAVNLNFNKKIGNAGVLETARKERVDQQLLNSLYSLMVGAVALVLGVWSLGWFRMEREHQEYLWLGATGVVMFVMSISNTLVTVLPVSTWTGLLPAVTINALWAASFVLFVCAFLGVRIGVGVRVYCASLLLIPAMVAAVLEGWLSPVFFAMGLTLISIPMDVVAPWLALRSYRRGDREAGLLLIALLVLTVQDLLNLADGIWVSMGHPRSVLDGLLTGVRLGPVALPQVQTAYLVFLLTVGAIMLRRSNLVLRQQQRARAELEAAQMVQGLLLARSVATPGFAVDTAYLPAQEVGGDFFQALPAADGGLLVVVGDVAGKGLQAAMRVSMILGAVRLLPEAGPAEVLERLNTLLLQESAEGSTGGFTTCLAARFHGGGGVTLSNAGHLPPYRNGVELELEGAFPLGVVLGARYGEESFAFVEGDRMLLLSDGVVEARAVGGELFGFERLRGEAAETSEAGALAERARSFGQEDDITVVVVAREAKAAAGEVGMVMHSVV